MTRVRLSLSALAVVAAAAMAALTLAPASTAARVQPTVTWTAPDAIGAATTTTSTTALYKFSSYVGGKPVRWNPCQAIHWKFRTVAGPAYGVKVAREAVRRIAYLTGTYWVEDSGTTAVPSSKWLPTSSSYIRPVLIGWTDGAHSDLLAGRPASVLGVTRTAYFGTSIDGKAVAATKAAVIALDRTNKLPLYGSVSWKTTLLHELGHAMGLDHVGNGSELMYPVLGRSLTDLQYGDRQGLYKLGRSQGCINLGF